MKNLFQDRLYSPAVRILLFLILLIIVAVLTLLVIYWLQHQINIAPLKYQSTQYEEVIEAIEQYRTEQGQYPADLSVLVPDYLPKVPGIYIEGGEMVDYLPMPSLGAPFTLYIYGHYTGRSFLRKWEEWELRYCPQDTCTYSSDHYPPQRVNRKWIWIYRPESRPLLGRQIVLVRGPEPTPLPGWRYPTSEFFVDKDAFPDGWVIEFPERTTKDPTVNYVAREWYQTGTSRSVFQGIWRSYTVADAEDWYAELRQRQFHPIRTPHPADLFIEFETSDEIGFQSQAADEFYLACGWWRWAYCEIVARYRNYVVEMRLDLEAEHEGYITHGLTYTEIEHIITAMDTKFVEVMEKLYTLNTGGDE